MIATGSSYFAYRSAPITRLPVELLSYIFALGTHAPTEPPQDDQPRSTDPQPFNTESITTPLVLSAVNRHWRHIARTTPALWTSLCVTVDFVEPNDPCLAQRPSALNTTHLTSYLALSRNFPLDIFIDARDPEWDFSETEIQSEFDFSTYVHPFRPCHMRTVISLLLPHISRWHSISILTDTWAPMHTALRQINPTLLANGAPLLESLSLMRCNDFASYSPEFQPADMKEPSFLDSASDKSTNIFPRLRHLTLRGVHVHWSSLPHLLPKPSSTTDTGLHTLDLSCHAPEVLPSLTEFTHLLAASPNLTKLTLHGSGPAFTDSTAPPSTTTTTDDTPVPLPRLDDITLGYRAAHDGCRLLGLLHAPGVKTLTLEDASHPADLEDVDAGCILRYAGTGARRAYPHTAYESQTTPAESPAPPFPLLESVTLVGVKACPRPFQTFFGAVPHLQRLELVGMSMDVVRALLPSSPVHVQKAVAGVVAEAGAGCMGVGAGCGGGEVGGAKPNPCPCPQLKSLCMRSFDRLRLQDFDFVVGGLMVERAREGACAFREVAVHVDGDGGEDVGVKEDVGVHSGTRVKVFREAVDCDYGAEYDLDAGLEEDEAEAFKVGGVFNDPAFDAYCAGRVFAR